MMTLYRLILLAKLYPLLQLDLLLTILRILTLPLPLLLMKRNTFYQ